jgi:PAS domain S-box-containing protein
LTLSARWPWKFDQGAAVDAIFEAVFLESPEAIAVTRARDGVIIAVNKEWLRLTGFSREQVLGRTAVDIGHWPNAQARQQMLQPLSVDGRVHEVDIPLVLADGSQRLMCMSVVLVDSEGESHMLVYLRDVTAARQAQAAARANEHALAQANETLSRQITLD